MNHQAFDSRAVEVCQPAIYSKISNVLVVDDHPLMCEALSRTLEQIFSLVRVRQAASLQAAEASIAQEGPPDAVVLDLNLPDVREMEGIRRLKDRLGHAPLTVISAEIDEAKIASAIDAGACGFISKTLSREQLAEAFAAMWRGELVLPFGMSLETLPRNESLVEVFATLTPQQMRILKLLCEGRPNKVISWQLSIAEATVKTHVTAIMNKINVTNRTQAALMARKAGLFAN